MHIGNNNCPFPTRPAWANSGGIEDGQVVAKLEQQDIEPHRIVLKLPDPAN